MYEARLAVAAGEQAIVADAVEPAWQDMEQKAADELVCGKRHLALPLWPVTAIVLEAEGYTLFIERDQPSVRDGDAVSVAREIGEYCFRSSERRLGVNDPTLLPNGRQMTQEGPTICQMSHVAVKAKLARIVERHQPGKEQAAEQLAEYPHRQQEGWARRYPTHPIRRDAAAGHDHMNVRVVHHRRSPCVEHRRNADPCAQMLGISGDGHHRLRRGFEQQIIN